MTEVDWGPDIDLFAGDSPTQEQQPFVVVPSNSTVDFEVSLNSTTTMIDQKVWLNGKLVSQLSDGKFLPTQSICAQELWLT